LLSGLKTVPPAPPALLTADPNAKSICPFVLSFVGNAEAGAAPATMIVPTIARVSATARPRGIKRDLEASGIRDTCGGSGDASHQA
jgi:hypothetical protein